MNELKAPALAATTWIETLGSKSRVGILRYFNVNVRDATRRLIEVSRAFPQKTACLRSEGNALYAIKLGKEKLGRNDTARFATDARPGRAGR
jgi:hypothetical protein